MSKRLNYVIAHPWDDRSEDSGLAIYTYFHEVQQKSSMKSAKNFLKDVKRSCPDEDWAIYKVKFTKVE